jgi:hypothetical protein
MLSHTRMFTVYCIVVLTSILTVPVTHISDLSASIRTLLCDFWTDFSDVVLCSDVIFNMAVRELPPEGDGAIVSRVRSNVRITLLHYSSLYYKCSKVCG